MRPPGRPDRSWAGRSSAPAPAPLELRRRHRRHPREQLDLVESQRRTAEQGRQLGSSFHVQHQHVEALAGGRQGQRRGQRRLPHPALAGHDVQPRRGEEAGDVHGWALPWSRRPRLGRGSRSGRCWRPHVDEGPAPQATGPGRTGPDRGRSAPGLRRGRHRRWPGRAPPRARPSRWTRAHGPSGGRSRWPRPAACSTRCSSTSSRSASRRPRPTGSRALVIQLNSRGATVSDDRLVELARQMAGSSVPVAVWVGPSGAQARAEAAQLVAVGRPGGLAAGAKVGKAGDQVLPVDEFGLLWGDQANRLAGGFPAGRRGRRRGCRPPRPGGRRRPGRLRGQPGGRGRPGRLLGGGRRRRAGRGGTPERAPANGSSASTSASPR